MELAIWVGAAVVILLGVVALAARREQRPWSDEEYERERRRGTALGSAFLAVQAIFDAGAQHTLEQRTAEEAEDTESAGPPAPGGMITIVSGPPGVGKTTIARELARRAPRGVHIVSDEFYYFISDLIAPSSAEAAGQNTTVITAVARAAAAFASGGYDVFLDGVFGPWFMPLLRTELRSSGRPLRFVVLRAPLEDCLARVAGRDARDMAGVVRKMHDGFVQLGELEPHVVETHERSVEETVVEIERRLASGGFTMTTR